MSPEKVHSDPCFQTPVFSPAALSGLRPLITPAWYTIPTGRLVPKVWGASRVRLLKEPLASVDSAAPLRQQVIDLRTANTIERLTRALGVDLELFQRVCLQGSSLYLRHEIPKRNKNRRGEYRVVWQALGPIERMHKTVARRLDVFFRNFEPRFPSDAAYGYVRGRSTRENARQHCNTKYLLKADIENFFPSISKDRIEKIFLDIDVPAISADALSTFVTINDQLAIGLHSSPVIANMACLQLDEKLKKVATKYHCTYTRYADDISISGPAQLPTREEIQQILEQEGFVLSSRKFKITKRGQGQYVTGLSISDYTPHAPRSMKHRLRQELYFASKYGLVNHLDRIGEGHIQGGINRLDGTVNYVSGIEKSNGENFRQLWRQITNDSDLGPKYTSREVSGREIHIFVDETDLHVDGEQHLALSFARTEEPELLRRKIENIKQDYLADPFSKGDKDKISKNNIHYTDAHYDLRKCFLDEIPSLPFSACVSFQLLPNSSRYREIYEETFVRILRQAFSTSDRADVRIFVEKNQKLSESNLQLICDAVHQELQASNARRPIAPPKLIFVGKEEPCISLPDFILATFRAYAASDTRSKNDPHRYLEFERVRDKIRYIEDGNRQQFYTRKRPFTPLS